MSETTQIPDGYHPADGDRFGNLCRCEQRPCPACGRLTCPDSMLGRVCLTCWDAGLSYIGPQPISQWERG